MERLREALAEYDEFFEHDKVLTFEAPLAAAARAVLDGQPKWECETHHGEGVPRLATDPFTCWKAEFTKHLDPADCSMFERVLVDPKEIA